MQDLSGKDVFDVVVRLPKTLGPAASVAQARTALEDDHVHMLLIANAKGVLLGTVVRDDLVDLDPTDRAVDHSVLEGRILGLGISAADAMALMLARGERRRAVIDAEGRLIGLLCLKRKLTGFCSDADVLARSHARGEQ